MSVPAEGGARIGRESPPLARAAADRTRRGARAWASRWVAFAALLIVAGTLGAFFAARGVSDSEAARARLAFHLSSDQVASALRLAIQREEDLVVGGSAFVARNPGTSAAAFDRWAESVHAMERYPELQNIGLVVMVPRAQLAAFEARMRAHPLLPLGLGVPGPREGFQVWPPGERPAYCFAVAGLARNLATYQPGGVDYCAIARTLAATRDTGQSSYAPIVAARTTLGVQTPVYRGGRVPATPAARRRAFIGWLGELIVPDVLLRHALQGHPRMTAVFRYRNGSSSAAFASGTPARGMQSTTIDLRNGWIVETFGPPVSSDVLADSNAARLFFGGALISLLLGLLVLVLGTGRRRALSLVAEKTRELSHQALHDALTGLPNRALVLDRAEQMIVRAGRDPELVAGALFIDVDDFKHVNDNLGHAAGDELLKVLAGRLQHAVREQDTVGRMGGDEFVVLVETHAREAPIEVLAERVIEAVREPVRLGQERGNFSFTASIGVAAGRYARPHELLRDADLALYSAKAAGKDRYALFDARMTPIPGEGLAAELELSSALWDGQLFLLYQPVFELAGGAIVAAEALVRWCHPARGVLAAEEFLDLAEASGLIVPMSRWVLREACREAAGWRAAGVDAGVAVNASFSHLARASFISDVGQALEDAGLEPAALTLELTEATLTRDEGLTRERLRELRALGVRVAIDDYGKGHAALAQLAELPADALKIDRGFVAALGEGASGRALLAAILGIARALSLTVIAEGIETHDQLEAVRELGCAMAQGYLLGRPAPAAELGADARAPMPGERALHSSAG